MAVSFREKNASFIVNNIPFVGVIFLSRKEAKGSSFRCLAIPANPASTFMIYLCKQSKIPWYNSKLKFLSFLM